MVAVHGDRAETCSFGEQPGYELSRDHWSLVATGGLTSALEALARTFGYDWRPVYRTGESTVSLV